MSSRNNASARTALDRFVLSFFLAVLNLCVLITLYSVVVPLRYRGILLGLSVLPAYDFRDDVWKAPDLVDPDGVSVG